MAFDLVIIGARVASYDQPVMAGGAGLVGGRPWTGAGSWVSRIFGITENAGSAVDFHAGIDLGPQSSILPEIIARTAGRGQPEFLNPDRVAEHTGHFAKRV